MSRIEQDKRRYGILLLRVFLGAVAVVAVPPFVLLAISPMLLLLAPVALVVLPFMVVAFAGAARRGKSKPQPTRAVRDRNSEPRLLRAAYPRLVPPTRSGAIRGSSLRTDSPGRSRGSKAAIAPAEPITQQLTMSQEPDAASRNFWLRVVIEPYSAPTKTCTLNVEGDLLIGRGESSGLLLTGALVSRRHVVIRAALGGLEIEDVSSHGTLVDGATLQRARLRVAHECILDVGCIRLWLRRLQQPEAAGALALPAVHAAARSMETPLLAARRARRSMM